MREKILWLYHNIFNLRLGILALPIVGGMVFFINLEHGWLEALRAGLIAGLTAIITTGSMTRLIQHAALLRRWWISYPVGTLIPASVTMSLHLPGQLANDTPELFWSVGAPVILTLVSSIVLNYMTKRYLQPKDWGRIDRLIRPLFAIPGRNPGPE